MGKIMLSKECAEKGIIYSQEASDQLKANVEVMDKNVNAQFSGLQDPTFRKYIELSENMQRLIKQISGRMDDISEYCRAVSRWIDEYKES